MTQSSIAKISFIQMQFTVFLSHSVKNQISVEKMVQLAPECILTTGPCPRSESIPTSCKYHDFFVFLKPFGTSIFPFLKQCVFFLAR